MAKEIAKPIISENTAKFKIDSVEFETFTLGSLPPTFQGIVTLLLFPNSYAYSNVEIVYLLTSLAFVFCKMLGSFYRHLSRCH